MIFFFLFILSLITVTVHCHVTPNKAEEGRYTLIFFLLVLAIATTGIKVLAILAGAP